MESGGTISLIISANNHRGHARQPCPPRWAHLLWSACLFALVAGCASTPPAPGIVPVWELANAEPITPQLIARARVSFDRPLPPQLTQKLSDEFTLVTVHRPADWQDLRRRLNLAESQPTPDFASGSIVGLLADVGECAQPDWPVQIKAVRTRAGLGSIESVFVPGLYYPLRTAGYLELVYVPGLSSVGLVKIGHRSFTVRYAAPVF